MCPLSVRLCAVSHSQRTDPLCADTRKALAVERLGRWGMLKIGIFVVVGTLLGMVLRFPGFALAVCVLLIAYAGFEWRGASLSLLQDLMLAAVALQVGYFFAILIEFVRHRRAKRNP
jgi:hypothetical protein